MSPTPSRQAALTNATMSTADDLASTTFCETSMFRFWPRGCGTYADELADGSDLSGGLSPDVWPEPGIFPPGYSSKSCSNMKKQTVAGKLIGLDHRYDDVLRSQVVSPVEVWHDPGMRETCWTHHTFTGSLIKPHMIFYLHALPTNQILTEGSGIR